MKTNRQINKKIKSFYIITIFIVISLFGELFTAKYSYANNIDNLENQTNINNQHSIANDQLKIYSDSAIIIENKTGKVLYEKNSEQRMYPASTTKILTAILTIEKGNLKDKTTVSRSAIAEMKSGYTSADLVEGEVLTIEQLLEVLLVRSANDASNVLAEYISGSIPNFVNLMNSKLQELGCDNTHFVTTNGLHDDNHYSTAKDMAKIARYCMGNATFRKIVSMPKCVIPSTNKSAERVYKNTNDLIINTSIYYYPGCIGIKTGFTSQAKNCLISACNKNGLQTIAVVLGASLTENRRSARYVDSKTLYDYAYENFTFSKIATAGSTLKTIEVQGATQETKNLNLLLQNDITSLVNKKYNQTIIPEIELNDNISAPIAQNTILGKATYTIDGQSYTSNLIAEHNVEKDETTITLLRFSILIGFFIIIIIIFMILIITIFKKLKKK